MKDTINTVKRDISADGNDFENRIGQDRIGQKHHLEDLCGKIVRLRNTRGNTQRGGVEWKWILLFLFCMILAMLATGCRKGDGSGKESEEIDGIEVALPAVDSVVIYSDYPATISSNSEAGVFAKVNGTILSRNYTSGQYVSKGQLLYVIESTSYSESVRQARARVESARSQLDYATKHLNALQEVYASEAVSEMEVQEARSAQAQARAALNSAQAALKMESLKLGYCRITAPISGNITSTAFDAGEYVAGEGSPMRLCTIYNDDDLIVSFNVPEYIFSDIRDTKEGFKADIYRNVPVVVSAAPNGDEDSGHTFAGDLYYEAPNIDPASGSITLRVHLANPTDYLRSGMYAKVKLPVKKINNGILVKDASISTDRRGKYLYTVNAKDEIQYTPIKTGELYHDSLRLVTEGISPTTRYVTRAMMNVRVGEKVKPVTVKTY